MRPGSRPPGHLAYNRDVNRTFLSGVTQAVTWALLLAAALVVLRRTPLAGRALPVLAGVALVILVMVLRRAGRAAGR